MENKKSKPVLKKSTLSIYAALFPMALGSTLSVYAQEKPEENPELLEHIEVKGTYKSLSEAAAIKRSAGQIVDAISAEDIGKLPDTNIAEALQRITGVTIGRDDAGDGTSFQIRGFSENSLTINGKGVVTDGFDNRENNLNALSSTIVKSITVSKTPTADQIEGGSGGSVELSTFSPLDFDDLEIRAVAEINDNSLNSAPSGKIGGLFSNQWEISDDHDLGFLINLEHENKNAYSEGFNAQYRGTDRGRNGNFDPVGVGRATALLGGLGQAPDHASFAPRWGQFEQREQDIETSTISGAIQWAPTQNLSIEFSGSVNDYTQNRTASRLRLDTQSLGGNRGGRGELGITLEPGATWHTLTRDPTINEFDAATLSGAYIEPNNPNAGASSRYFTSASPATASVSRSLLTSGIFLADSQNNNQNSPVNSRGQLRIEEKTQKNFGIDIEWYITDNLNVNMQYGESQSETDITNREMNVQLETVHPETGARLYPSLAYDIRDSGDLPSYDILWREPILDSEGNRIGGRNIEGFTPDYLDPNQRNDLHRLNRLNKQLNRTRGYIDELRLDFDWDVELAGVTQVEFGARYDKLENFKDRSDFRTPFIPGFQDNDADGIPDDLDGDGLPDGLQRRGNQPNRTFSSLIETPLTDSQGEFSSVTPEMVDEFLVLRTGMKGIDGNFPRQFWGTTDDVGKWDDFINAVYGGHEVILNDLQTEKTFEDTKAFYLKLNFEYEVAGMPLTGNIGVRHGETTGQSEAFISHCNMPWQVDVEKTNVVRAERAAYDEQLLAWQEAGSNPDDALSPFTPSFWDEALSNHQGRNDAPGAPQRTSFCTTRTEVGGPPVALIFKNDPWAISENYPATAILTTGTSATDGGSRWKDYLASEYDYNFTLPSLNLSLGLQDDMFLRFSAYKTLARPGGNDLSLDPSCGGPVCTQGNPNLKPFETNSFDLAWEWYMSETDSISATYFHKDLVDQKVFFTDFNVDLNRLVRRPVNGGDGAVKGIELGAVHTFTYLPIEGFGVLANFTYVDSSQTSEWDEFTGLTLPIANRSESTYNLQFFYENNGWSARLAYNWRDESLRPNQEQDYKDFSLASIDDDRTMISGSQVFDNRIAVNPRSWNEEYAQLDFSIGYDFSDNLGVLFRVTNVTEEAKRAYTVIESAPREYNLAASSYRLSVNWQF